MGIFDSIRSIFGTSAEADATRAADPEDLFGMSTAYLTMAADLGCPSAGEAALCFSNVDSTDFTATVEEVEAILDAGREETGTDHWRHSDDYGYHWFVLADPDPEDLVTSVHFAADEFVERGYGSRLLAALFAFERDGDDGGGREGYVYWVYSFRRGAYYPFVPTGTSSRDSKREFKLQAVLDGELTVEDDEGYWYPLWPDRAGQHPWE